MSVLDFLPQAAPGVLLALILYLALLPLRRRSLAQRNLVSGLGRELALAAFVAFCGGLAALTLFPDRFWMDGFVDLLEGRQVYPTWVEIRESLVWLPQNLVPFHEISRTWDSGWKILILAGNILLFLPVGLAPALLWRDGTWRRSLAAGLGSSCLIEFVQLFIARGTDIDDVILNTAGAMLGYALAVLLRRLCPRLCRALLPGHPGAVYCEGAPLS